MRQTKVYDWSGTLVTIDGFIEFLKEKFFDVYDLYYVQGKNNSEIKRGIRPKVLDIFEDATDRGLYPMELLPNVHGRLESDSQQGYVRTVFTSIPRDTIESQMRDMGVADRIDEVVVLSDITQYMGVAGAMKEDPETFKYFMHFLTSELGLNAVTYTDDTPGRINAAVESHGLLVKEGIESLRTLYLLDTKAVEPSTCENGYTRINDIIRAI